MSGTARGPDGDPVPNITSHKPTGIGGWPESDIRDLLRLGMLPDGDFVGGAMAEVVGGGTSKLSDADLAALAHYLKSLPPIANNPFTRR
jgi:hypothetical protein